MESLKTTLLLLLCLGCQTDGAYVRGFSEGFGRHPINPRNGILTHRLFKDTRDSKREYELIEKEQALRSQAQAIELRWQMFPDGTYGPDFGKGWEMYPDGTYGPNTGRGFQMYPDGTYGPK